MPTDRQATTLKSRVLIPDVNVPLPSSAFLFPIHDVLDFHLRFGLSCRAIGGVADDQYVVSKADPDLRGIPVVVISGSRREIAGGDSDASSC
jgi:hypothetical protein